MLRTEVAGPGEEFIQILIKIPRLLRTWLLRTLSYNLLVFDMLDIKSFSNRTFALALIRTISVLKNP